MATVLTGITVHGGRDRHYGFFFTMKPNSTAQYFIRDIDLEAKEFVLEGADRMASSRPLRPTRLFDLVTNFCVNLRSRTQIIE